MSSDKEIIQREDELRTWFTKDIPKDDPIYHIDSFDIGWGGTARYATSRLAEWLDPQQKVLILDVACGYGTFLVELGWRFPLAQLFGLNLDFDPPHNLIIPLLSQGQVTAQLLSADALQLPLKSGNFDCISCFLGLQDIAITRGTESLGTVVSELFQAVSPEKFLLLVDNLPSKIFQKILFQQDLKYELLLEESFDPECRWSREVGLQAVNMYAQGYLQQQLRSDNPPKDLKRALEIIRKEMKGELEHQLETQGYYNPWGIMKLFILQRT